MGLSQIKFVFIISLFFINSSFNKYRFHQESDNLAEDVLNEFLQSNPAAPMAVNNEDDSFILSDDLTNFNFIQEFDLNNPTCTLPMNDHNILDSYLDQSSKQQLDSSSSNPVYLDFNLNTNTFINKPRFVAEDVKKNISPVCVSGSSSNQKENLSKVKLSRNTNSVNRVVPIKKTVIPDFYNSRKPITTVYRKPLHTKTSYKISLIEKEKVVQNDVEILFKTIDTKDIKIPMIDDFPKPERTRKQKFQNLLYLDCSIEFEDSSPKKDHQPISVIKIPKSEKINKKNYFYQKRDSDDNEGEDSEDEKSLAELLKKNSQKCDFCSKFFKTVRSLSNHKKDCEKSKKVPEKRKLVQLNEPQKQPKKIIRTSAVEELPKLSDELRCDICNRNFRQKSYLIAHLKTHEISKKAK